MRIKIKFVSFLLIAILAMASGMGQPVSHDSNSVKSPAVKTPARFEKVIIRVVDLEDGSPLGKVEISAGTGKSGFTNKDGILELENILTAISVNASVNGYIGQSKKAKPGLTFKMLKSGGDDKFLNGFVNNGFFHRPTEQYAGASVTLSGNRLRILNPVSLAEAIAIADPAFISLRNNQNGDDPNQLSHLGLRGALNFPAAASIATTAVNGATGVQVTPAGSDYIAEQVRNPNQPLLLLDGIQVSLQQLADMDIYRVEKVTLLKDAAATAVYGSRAGNGVVLVETKQPVKGVLNIHYNGQIQLSAPNLDSYNLMNASEKLELEKKAGVYANNDALYQQRLQSVNNGVNTNWLKEPTQTGIGSRHSLMLDGGDEVIRYGLDFSTNNLEGTMQGSKRKVMNIGGFLKAQIKAFTISNYLSYNQATGENSPYGNFSDYAKLNPYWNSVDSLTGGISKILEEYTLHTTSGDSVVRIYNPAFNSTLATTDKTNYNRLSNLLKFSQAFGHGFKLDGRIFLTTTSEVSDQFLPPSHTAFSKSTPDQFFKRGLYSQSSRGFEAAEGSLVLHYSRQKGLHYWYAAAGTTMLATQSEATGILVQGFTSDQIANVAFGSGYANSAPTAGKIHSRLISGFGSATYSYESRYQLDATFTREGASEFGANARYENYYSGAASWNLHNEHFFKPNKFISQLRLRLGSGKVGNRFFQEYLGNTSFDYFTNQQYILGGSGIGTRGIGLGNYMVAAGNPSLQSPYVLKTNAAMDAVLLKNRIFLRFEFYKETSKNLILPVYSPASTGFSNFSWYENLGGIENKGMEFSASWMVLNNTKSGIQWTIGANGLHNQGKITATSSYLDVLNSFNNSNADQTHPQAQYVVGQSLTAIRTVPSLGIDPATGKEKFRKADGSESFDWNAADKVVSGDLAAKWRGNFGTTLAYKKLSLGAWFYWQTGAKYYNQTLADKVENADLSYNTDKRAGSNRWQQPGDQAAFKPLYINGLLSSPTYATSRFVEDANFITYSSMSVKYTWPSLRLVSVPLQNTSIGFVANQSFRPGYNQAESGIQYPFSRFYTFTFSTSIQ